LLDRIIENPKSEFARGGIRIVRYCDDFILLGGHITDNISDQLESILTRMGLRLNKEKTSRKQLWKEPIDFLGITIRWHGHPIRDL